MGQKLQLNPHSKIASSGIDFIHAQEYSEVAVLLDFFFFSLVALSDICKKSGSAPVPVKVNKGFVALTKVCSCKLRCRRKMKM